MEDSLHLGNFFILGIIGFFIAYYFRYYFQYERENWIGLILYTFVSLFTLYITTVFLRELFLGEDLFFDLIMSLIMGSITYYFCSVAYDIFIKVTKGSKEP